MLLFAWVIFHVLAFLTWDLLVRGGCTGRSEIRMGRNASKQFKQRNFLKCADKLPLRWRLGSHTHQEEKASGDGACASRWPRRIADIAVSSKPCNRKHRSLTALTAAPPNPLENKWSGQQLTKLTSRCAPASDLPWPSPGLPPSRRCTAPQSEPATVIDRLSVSDPTFRHPYCVPGRNLGSEMYSKHFLQSLELLTRNFSHHMTSGRTRCSVVGHTRRLHVKCWPSVVEKMGKRNCDIKSFNARLNDA